MKDPRNPKSRGHEWHDYNHGITIRTFALAITWGGKCEFCITIFTLSVFFFLIVLQWMGCVQKMGTCLAQSDWQGFLDFLSWFHWCPVKLCEYVHWFPLKSCMFLMVGVGGFCLCKLFLNFSNWSWIQRTPLNKRANAGPNISFIFRWLQTSHSAKPWGTMGRASVFTPRQCEAMLAQCPHCMRNEIKHDDEIPYPSRNYSQTACWSQRLPSHKDWQLQASAHWFTQFRGQKT